MKQNRSCPCLLLQVGSCNDPVQEWKLNLIPLPRLDPDTTKIFVSITLRWENCLNSVSLRVFIYIVELKVLAIFIRKLGNLEGYTPSPGLECYVNFMLRLYVNFFTILGQKPRNKVISLFLPLSLNLSHSSLA